MVEGEVEEEAQEEAQEEEAMPWGETPELWEPSPSSFRGIETRQTTSSTPSSTTFA